MAGGWPRTRRHWRVRVPGLHGSGGRHGRRRRPGAAVLMEQPAAVGGAAAVTAQGGEGRGEEASAQAADQAAEEVADDGVDGQPPAAFASRRIAVQAQGERGQAAVRIVEALVGDGAVAAGQGGAAVGQGHGDADRQQLQVGAMGVLVGVAGQRQQALPGRDLQRADVDGAAVVAGGHQQHLTPEIHLPGMGEGRGGAEALGVQQLRPQLGQGIGLAPVLLIALAGGGQVWRWAAHGHGPQP